MSSCEDKEVEHELVSSQNILDEFASGRTIGPDSEKTEGW